MDARRVWTWVAATAAVAVIAAAAVWYYSGGSQVEVPNVTGSNSADAVRALEAAGFVLGKTTPATGTPTAAGIVISQRPDAGAKTAKGSAVDVTVAQGTSVATVPDVRGKEASAATAAIAAAGLVPTPYGDFDETAAAGMVFGQMPGAGRAVPEGTSVVFGVSKGAAPVSPTVRDVVGKTTGEAMSSLVKAGFSSRVYYAHSATVASGLVMSQFPAAGTRVLDGSTVAIQVSKGKGTATSLKVSVPNVVGRLESAATSALKNSGLSVESYREFSDKVAKGRIFGQLPAAGFGIEEGTIVALAVSDGRAPASVTVPDLVGKTADEATSTLIGLGLKPVALPDPKSASNPGIVIGQLPEAGSQLPPDSVVVITVAGAMFPTKPTTY